MADVIITHPNGTTDEIAAVPRSEWAVEIGKRWSLEIDVQRSDLDNINLQRKEDDVELVGVATGRLTDVQPLGSVTRLTVDSFEWVADQTEPFGGGTKKSGGDATIFSDFIAEMPEITAGTVNEQVADISFIVNHAFPAEAARRLEKAVPGELWFTDDKQLDYVAELGSGRTDVEISAAEGNVDGEISILKRGRSLEATHVTLLGAHEGEAQKFVTLVPASDSSTYDNRVNYTNPDWDDGDAETWDRISNNELATTNALEAEADAIAGEIVNSFIEAEADVVDVDINIGDKFTVKKVADGQTILDEELRAVAFTRIQEGSTVRYRTRFSSRTMTRSSEFEKVSEDADRTNVAFQGSSIEMAIGPVEQNVDVGEPLEMPFRFPDLQFENFVELHIDSRAFRHYSQPVGHNHGVSISDHTHDVIMDTHTHGYTLKTLSHHHVLEYQRTITTELADGHTHDADVAGNTYTFDGTPVPDLTGDVRAESTSESAETSASAGGEIETTEAGGSTTTTTTDTEGVKIGVETTAELPAGVDVKIDGTTVATDIGSGTFQQTLDLSGQFTPGAWTTIEITTDNPGRFIATLAVGGYRQIGTVDA